MYLSRIKIENFRNFSLLDVTRAGNVVVVGENRLGKSNLLQALRLLLHPTLADSACQLGISDFWDGLETPGENDKITCGPQIFMLQSVAGCIHDVIHPGQGDLQP